MTNINKHRPPVCEQTGTESFHKGSAQKNYIPGSPARVKQQQQNITANTQPFDLERIRVGNSNQAGWWVGDWGGGRGGVAFPTDRFIVVDLSKAGRDNTSHANTAYVTLPGFPLFYPRAWRGTRGFPRNQRKPFVPRTEKIPTS